MRIASSLVASAALFAIVQAASAQTPAPAPAPSTEAPAASPATSPAPSATPAKHHRRKKAADAPAASPEASPAPGAEPAAGSPAPVKQARARHTPPKLDPNATPAPGGGPGMVWVNTKSNVYHQSTSRYYGKTKEGKYMSEKDAQAAGAHAAPHNE